MNKSMSRSLTGLTGIALAAGAMYIFDPERGKLRRAEIGDRCKGAARRVREGTQDLREDISERYRAASTRMSSWLNSRSRADARLGRRVRIDLWRELKDASGIGVIAHDGTVILHGEVLPQQHKQVLEVVGAVEGVVEVADHLNKIGIAKSSGARPRIQQGLQQGFTRVRDSVMQEHWTPTTRVCSGTLGLALMGWGAQQRNLVSGIGALTGAVLLMRSTTNKPLKGLARRGRKAVEQIPGAEPVSEAIERAGDKLEDANEWRKSAATSVGLN